MIERVFEIKKRISPDRGGNGEPEFYAQTHCACGSTMGSGEWFPSVRRAVEEARSNIERHERGCKVTIASEDAGKEEVGV